MKKLISTLLFFFCLQGLQAQVNAIISKGNKYYAASQFELAEKAYREALRAEPANATARYNLANALHQQKKWDEALAILETLVGEGEDSLRSAAYYNQGVTHTKQKNLEASIESYKNALRIDPTDQQARENLQKALSELKKQQQQQQQDQKQNKSSMNQNEAEQKLKLLQEKERKLQERLHKQSKEKGGSQSRDW